jgi:hypothetical protein
LPKPIPKKPEVSFRIFLPCPGQPLPWIQGAPSLSSVEQVVEKALSSVVPVIVVMVVVAVMIVFSALNRVHLCRRRRFRFPHASFLRKPQGFLLLLHIEL